VPNLEILKQRVPHTTCARCRKLFRAGDRMAPAYIVKNPNARDPATQQLSAEIAAEFEFVHASCADPMLDGKVIITQ
jgi:hypothetical protein